MFPEIVTKLNKIAGDIKDSARDQVGPLLDVADTLEKDAAAEKDAAELIAAEEAYIKEAIEECDGADREIAAALETIEAAKKRKEKWIQKAVTEKTEGDFTEWCNRRGFKGVCQACVDKAVEVGGRPQKMALFAVNVSKGKYTYPSKEKDASENEEPSMAVDAGEEDMIIESAQRVIEAAKKRKKKWIKGIGLKKGRLTSYKKPGESMMDAARRALRSDKANVRGMGAFFISSRKFKHKKKGKG